MISVRVPGFTTEAYAFRFANRFPPVPLRRIDILTLGGGGIRVGSVALGNAANGLCGGMALASRDFFEYGIKVPQGVTPAPGEDEPLFRYIVDRLLASFDLPLGAARYYEWMALPDADLGLIPGVVSRTRQAWLAVKDELERDRPAALGLIRAQSSALADLGKNHQVLCYGYDLDDAGRSVTLHLYDPNHPYDPAEPQLDVTLSCDLGPGPDLALRYSTGEATRGFFLTPYRRHDPTYAVIGPPPVPAWSRLFASIRAIFP